jgi:predicted nucleotidyltransferase
MLKKNDILTRIKDIVSLTEPEATIILYGSYAKGVQKDESDIDILILINKEKITYSDEIRIKYPLYELEFETGTVISPIVFSRDDWEIRHKITPFYKNVKQDGILL